MNNARTESATLWKGPKWLELLLLGAGAFSVLPTCNNGVSDRSEALGALESPCRSRDLRLLFPEKPTIEQFGSKFSEHLVFQSDKDGRSDRRSPRFRYGSERHELWWLWNRGGGYDRGRGGHGHDWDGQWWNHDQHHGSDQAAESWSLGPDYDQPQRQSSGFIEIDALRRATELSGLVAMEFPTGALQACDGAVATRREHEVHLHFRPKPRPWAQGTLDSLHYPKDFAIVAFGDALGLRGADGPLLVGGVTALEQFELSGSGRHQLAIVGGGDVTLKDGLVQGKIVHGGELSLEAVRHRGGAQSGTPIPFERVQRRLAELSDHLTKLEPNAKTVRDEEGNLELRGRHQGVNLFAVDARALERARRIRLDVPRDSAAVVNVRGRRLSFEDLSVELRGPRANDVLWNVEGTEVALQQVEFEGTLLAPRAEVEIETHRDHHHHHHTYAALEGSVVAASVKGPLYIDWVPFEHWERLPFPRGIEVVGASELMPACNYVLTISDQIPLDDHGRCLAEPVNLPVRVWRNVAEAFSHKVERVMYSPAEGDPAALRFSAEARVRPQELFDRYASVFGVRAGLDSLRPAGGATMPAGEANPTRLRFDQYYDGFPVLAHGYWLQLDDEGFVVAASGSFQPRLQVNDLEPRVGLRHARRVAEQHLRGRRMPIGRRGLASEGLVIATGDPTNAVEPHLAWMFVDPLSPAIRVGVNAEDASIAFGPAALTATGGSQPLPDVAYGIVPIEEPVDVELYGGRIISVLQYESADDPASPFFELSSRVSQQAGSIDFHTSSLVAGAEEPFDQDPLPVTSREVEGGLASDSLIRARSAHWSVSECIEYFQAQTSEIAAAEAGRFDAVLVSDWSEVGHEEPDGVDTLGLFFPARPNALFLLDDPTAPALALDVVCHEYSHALAHGWIPGELVDWTAKTESRALLEGSADLMGTLAELSILGDDGDWRAGSVQLDRPELLSYCPFTSPAPQCFDARWREIYSNQGELIFFELGSLIGTWGYLTLIGADPIENDLGCSYSVAPFAPSFEESLPIFWSVFPQALRTTTPDTDMAHFAQQTFDHASQLFPNDPAVPQTVRQAWAVKNISVFPQNTTFALACPEGADGTPASSDALAPWMAQLCWPVDDADTTWHVKVTDLEEMAVTDVSTNEFFQAVDGQTYARATISRALDQNGVFLASCASDDSCASRRGQFLTGTAEVSLRNQSFEGDSAADGYWVFGTIGPSDGECAAPFECNFGTLPPSPVVVGPEWDPVPGAASYRLRVVGDGSVECSLTASNSQEVPATGDSIVTCPPGSCLADAAPFPAENFLQVQPVHATGLVGVCKTFPFRLVENLELLTTVAQPEAVVLEWTGLGDAALYEVQVYEANGVTSIFDSSDLGEPGPETSVELELGEGFYTWQVAAIVGGVRVLSPLQKLTVAIPITLEDEDEKLGDQPWTIAWNATAADVFFVEFREVDEASGNEVLRLGPSPIEPERSAERFSADLSPLLVGQILDSGSRFFVSLTERYSFPGTNGEHFVEHTDETSFTVPLVAEITSPSPGEFVDGSVLVQWAGTSADQYRVRVLRLENGVPFASIFLEVVPAQGSTHSALIPGDEFAAVPPGAPLRIDVTPQNTDPALEGIIAHVDIFKKEEILLIWDRSSDFDIEYCGHQLGAHMRFVLDGTYPQLLSYQYIVDGPAGTFTGELPYCGDDFLVFPVGARIADGLTLIDVFPESADDRFTSVRVGGDHDGFGSCGDLQEACCDQVSCNEGTCSAGICLPDLPECADSSPLISSAGALTSEIGEVASQQQLIALVGNGTIPSELFFAIGWENVGAPNYEILLGTQTCPFGPDAEIIDQPLRSADFTVFDAGACDPSASFCGLIVDALDLLALGIDVSCQGFYVYAVRAECEGGGNDVLETRIVHIPDLAAHPLP